MDVDSPAASRIVGQPTVSAAASFKAMWRTFRRPLPTLTGFSGLLGCPESGSHHRLATGEAAS
jgi:hypothetical protein